MRLLYTARKSFWGRVAFGPAMALIPVAIEALKQPVKGNYRYVAMWLTHFILVGLLLTFVKVVADISPLHYVFGIAYPALSLAMIRSYYEHRAADDCKHRIVINEASWPMRLLYLNNNYHLVHHDLPSLPWYLLPQVYRANRSDYIARCDDFLVAGYGTLMWRFGFRPVDAPVHPMGKVQSTS
jgi:fatty acid desaturase